MRVSIPNLQRNTKRKGSNGCQEGCPLPGDFLHDGPHSIHQNVHPGVSPQELPFIIYVKS